MSKKAVRVQKNSSRLRDLAAGVLLLVSILVVYFPALHGGLVWDDDGHVTRRDLQSLHGLWRIWFDPGAKQQYYPLLHSAFWLEHRLWGDVRQGLVAVLVPGGYPGPGGGSGAVSTQCYPFIYSWVADYFVYLASLGILIPIAAGLTAIAERSPGGL
jgi:hypothetical protein